MTHRSRNTLAIAVCIVMGDLKIAPTPDGLAGPRVQMEQSRMEIGTGLARGTSAQMEAGEIAAWAGNLPPDPPSRLGPEAFVLGDATSTTNVALTFTLSDPDPGDRVRAVVEVSTRADFGVIVTSTAGGPEGPPLRTTSPLSEGWYWWRVKAVDAGGAESSWSVANGGEGAFAVDDDPPGAGLGAPAAGTVVQTGQSVEIRGWVSGEDVKRWTMTDGRPGGRPYAEGTSREIKVSWTPTEPAGRRQIILTAVDEEGFTARARVAVMVSTAGRPEGRPLRGGPEMAEEAYGFRSAGVGPNPARVGAHIGCHLAVGRADAMRAALYAASGELVQNTEAGGPVWHGGQLCYEPMIDSRALASGVYLLVLDAEREGQPPVRAVRKVIVIK